LRRPGPGRKLPAVVIDLTPDGGTGVVGGVRIGPARPSTAAAVAPRDYPRRGMVCLVIDDQAVSAQQLARHLRAQPRVGQVAVAADALAARRFADEVPVDVVFLETAVSGQDGVELARVLRRAARPPELVFVAQAGDRAADAFDVGAADYLLKPARPHRLREALQRVAARRSALPRLPVGPVPDPGPDGRLPVPTATGVRMLHYSAIRWAEAMGDYVRLHTSEGEYVVRHTIARLASCLADAGVERIHRSFLVRWCCVEGIGPDRTGAWTVHIDGRRLPVSRRRAAALGAWWDAGVPLSRTG